MIRAFIAIPLPEFLADDLTLLQGGAFEARWVAPENFHITLSFLGDAPEHLLEDVDAALLGLRAAPFELRLAGSGAFGGDRPHALYIGLESSAPLNALRKQAERAAREAGAEMEHRAFHPHVTLAYLGKRAPRDAAMDWAAGRALYRSAPFLVERFALYRSDLGRDGSIYTALAEYDLS